VRRLLRLALCIVLITGLAVPLSLRNAFAQNRYALLDSAAVQQIPNRQGGILGIKTATPLRVDLLDGRNIVVSRVDRVDHREPSPIRINDVLYAVDGLFFSTADGMPRYVQSLAPGSTATVEYVPRE
jgi:hypothetical protein